jgi:formylmethanofuran dehydrogenase subunit D
MEVSIVKQTEGMTLRNKTDMPKGRISNMGIQRTTNGTTTPEDKRTQSRPKLIPRSLLWTEVREN